jgi:hypothetical protein
VKWVDVWSVDASLVIDATLALGCGGASVEWDGETRNGITWVGSDVGGWLFFLGSEVDTRNRTSQIQGGEKCTRPNPKQCRGLLQDIEEPDVDVTFQHASLNNSLNGKTRKS